LAKEKIVIDEEKGLIFSSEEELYNHFSKEIDVLEKEFQNFRNAKEDIPTSKFTDYEDHLSDLLEDPDEIWETPEYNEDSPLAIYLKVFKQKNGEQVHHIALCHLTDDIPSFVYLHFPTKDLSLVAKYQKGDLVYDEHIKNAPQGAIEGDALLSGDRLALGLYNAMVKLRSVEDILEEEFYEFAYLREEGIEEADEIWRRTDSMGNVLVTFIKEFTVSSKKIFYVVVTVEDQASNSHALLFSFPTIDNSLASRYRQGENLQAEEVVQESSH